MCFNPFKFIERVFTTIFGGNNPQPTGPTTHAKGLANRLTQKSAGETPDTDLKKDKKDTKTDLSLAQLLAKSRVSDSNKQVGKLVKNPLDLLGTGAGISDTPLIEMTSISA